MFLPVTGSVTDSTEDLHGRGFEPQLCFMRLKSADQTARARVCGARGGGGSVGWGLMGLFQYKSDK
jgi:hypothetical protein